MKHFNLLILFLSLWVFTYAQNETLANNEKTEPIRKLTPQNKINNETWIQVLIRNKKNGRVKNFDLPRKVGFAFKNNFNQFDSIEEHYVKLHHISEIGDTLYFTELHKKEILAITFNQLRYIRFERSLMGYLINGALVFYSALGSGFLIVQIVNPQYESLPGIAYLYLALSPVVLYLEIRNYNRMFSSDKYLIKEVKVEN